MTEKLSVEERIINAGIELAKQTGTEEVQVNDICAAAGVSKGTFYKYFKSKDGLFSQIYSSMEPHIMEMLPGILLKDISPLQQFWLVFKCLIERTIELGPKGVEYIARSGFNESGTHAFLYSGSESKLRDVHISLLKKCQDAGLIRRDCEADVLMEHISLFVVGANIQWSASNGGFDYTEKLFNHFMLLLEAHPDFGPYDNPKDK